MGATQVYSISGEALRAVVQGWIDGTTAANDGLVLIAEPWQWGFYADLTELDLELDGLGEIAS